MKESEMSWKDLMKPVTKDISDSIRDNVEYHKRNIQVCLSHILGDNYAKRKLPEINHPSDLLEWIFDNDLEELFPNVKTAVQILLPVPVSIAKRERFG